MSNPLQKAYCINLDRCPQNWKNIQNEWSDVLDIERIPAIDGNAVGISGNAALRETTFRVFQRMLVENPRYFVLMEDDVYKTEQFNKDVWGRILQFIQNNDNWDMITLDPLDVTGLRAYNSEFTQLSTFTATGFIIYNTRFIRRNIKRILRIRGRLDLTLTYRFGDVKLTPSSLLTRQKSGKRSTISRVYRDTEWIDTAYDKTGVRLQSVQKKDEECA